MAAHLTIASFLHSPATILGQNTQQLKTIDSQKNLHEALKVFAETKVFALPVLKNGQFLGLITIKSVVKQLLGEFYRVGGVSGKSSQEKEKAMSSFSFTHDHLHEIQSHFSKQHVEQHIDVTSKPLSSNATVLEVTNSLQTSDRVVVSDSNGKLTHLYSQSGALKYLGSHMDILGVLAEKEIGSIPNLVTRPAKIIEGSTRALVALSIMVEEGFSSLGFQNDEKDVEGVLSFKDIKAAANNLSPLLNPVADYVNEIRRTDTDNLLRDVVPTVNCSTSDPLKKVIGKLNAVGIHRLFVHEKEEKGYHFTGIITLSDVMKLVLRSK